MYDKPLFAGTSASAIYRPRKNVMESEGSGVGPGDDDDDGGEHAGDRERVRNILAHGRPNKGFSGAKDAPERDGPVQFERENNRGASSSTISGGSSSHNQSTDDPFGLDAFLTEASGRGKKAIQQIGKSGGTMSLAAGSSDLLRNSRNNRQNESNVTSSSNMKRARHDSDEDDD